MGSSLVPLRHNREFRLLWIGQAVSALGSNISSIAYPLLVLATGGSATEAGLVGFAHSLPLALLQLPAGALTDRWERKRVMLVCDAVRALALAVVAAGALAGHAPVLLLAVAGFIEGSLTVFFTVVERGAVRHVVPDAQLDTAIAQIEARVRGSTLLGQPLGGILFGIGRAVPFLADAGSYAVSFVTLAAMRTRFNEQRTAPRRHLLAETREGIAWLWNQRFLRACLLLVAASNFVFSALILAIIVLARDHGAGSSEIGIMLAGFGGGGLLGAIAAPWLQPRLSPRTIVVGANWWWTALVPLMVLLPNPYAIGVLGGAMAFIGPVWNVVIGAYELRLTPDALLGRVMGVAGQLSGGAIPLGSLVAGFLLDRIGAEATILALAGWQLATAVVGSLSRDIRNVPSLA